MFRLLSDRPNLLLLDSFETLLQPGEQEERYRDGYAAYGTVLRALAEGRHRSCVVVTSREAPPELAVSNGEHRVRTLELYDSFGLG